MTKSALIEQVTEKVEGLTKKQVEVIIDTVFDGMKDALARGEKIEIGASVTSGSSSGTARWRGIPRQAKRCRCLPRGHFISR